MIAGAYYDWLPPTKPRRPAVGVVAGPDDSVPHKALVLKQPDLGTATLLNGRRRRADVPAGVHLGLFRPSLSQAAVGTGDGRYSSPRHPLAN